MRTLIKCILKQNLLDSNVIAYDLVKKWLQDNGYSPRHIEFTQEIMDLFYTENNDLTKLTNVPEVLTEALHSSNPEIKQAAEMLCSIPNDDGERSLAARSIKYVIIDKTTVSTANVWGIVSIEDKVVEFRFRHKVSHALEKATEHIVSRIQSDNDESIFEKIPTNTQIPVREPNATQSIYEGTVLAPGLERKAIAKKHKRYDILTAWTAVISSIIATAAGFYISYFPSKYLAIIWFGNFSDRLATASMATAAVSSLHYWFYLKDLQSKPPIIWQ
ncbi:MAG: hypothetical protein WCP10_06375 [Desulfuromonadales bacterium]